MIFVRFKSHILVNTLNLRVINILLESKANNFNAHDLGWCAWSHASMTLQLFLQLSYLLNSFVPDKQSDPFFGGGGLRSSADDL